MSDDGKARPTLSVEAKQLVVTDEAFRPPHCFQLILHLPSQCEFCAKATGLQEERARLGVSNTGANNRPWPCPADRVRSTASQNSWAGNRPMSEDALKRHDAEWAKLREELRLTYGDGEP